jgi:hypothetical protein
MEQLHDVRRGARKVSSQDLIAKHPRLLYLIGATIGVFVLQTCLRLYFTRANPTIADSSSQRTVAMDGYYHYVVYLSYYEYMWYDIVRWILSVLVGVTGIYLIYILRAKQR